MQVYAEPKHSLKMFTINMKTVTSIVDKNIKLETKIDSYNNSNNGLMYRGIRKTVLHWQPKPWERTSVFLVSLHAGYYPSCSEDSESWPIQCRALLRKFSNGMGGFLYVKIHTSLNVPPIVKMMNFRKLMTSGQQECAAHVSCSLFVHQTEIESKP